MTQGDPGVLSEELPTAPLVNRDSVTRRARRWGVEFEVAELSLLSEAFVREKLSQRQFTCPGAIPALVGA